MAKTETELEKAQRVALEAEDKMAQAQRDMQAKKKRLAEAEKKEVAKVRETFARDFVEALIGKPLTNAETIDHLPKLMARLKELPEFVALQGRFQQSRTEDSPVSNDEDEASSVTETSGVMEQPAMPNVTHDEGHRY